ncbi:MAG: SGNH/GDSL hydrolase family protein [Actinomycetota bacterium]
MTPGGSRLLTHISPVFTRVFTQTLRPAMAGLLAAVLAVSVVVMPTDAAGNAKAPKKTLLVLGDSLTWGANYFAKTQSRLTASGQYDVVVVDGWWSRRIGGIISTTYSGTNTYKKLVAGGLRPTAVIVGLGTNDVYFLSKRREYATLIRELMDTIGEVPVVWVNVHRVESPSTVNRSRLFNDTLERVIAEYPLASTFDWAGLAKKSPTVMAWDKIHHSPSGYEVRTKVYLELAATLAQRASDMTTTTTVAPTTVPTTVAPTTVPPTTVAPTTTLAP